MDDNEIAGYRQNGANEMKAKFTKKNVQNGKNHGGDKETVSTWNVVGYKKGEFRTVVRCRCYMGRSAQASVVYASIWVHNGAGIEVAGHGSAGGYGYHKESAAIGSAIESAGIELYGSAYVRHGETEDLKQRARIDGVGDTAIEAALSAIATAAGYRKFTIVRG